MLDYVDFIADGLLVVVAQRALNSRPHFVVIDDTSRCGKYAFIERVVHIFSSDRILILTATALFW